MIELAVGNVHIGAGFGSFGCRGRSLSNRRNRRSDGSGIRVGQTRQRGQQLGRGRCQFSPFAHLGKHAVNGVKGLQDHVHQLWVDASSTLAQHVKDVFRNMATFHQLIELQKACTALDGMETAEDRIEQIHIIRTAFQLHQLFGQLLENLAGLHQEILEDFIIGVEAHNSAP